MTEEEAKTKWCPQMGITLAIEAVTKNAQGGTLCIASNCMMWAWDAANYIQDPMKPANQEIRTSTTEGCCGLIR